MARPNKAGYKDDMINPLPIDGLTQDEKNQIAIEYLESLDSLSSLQGKVTYDDLVNHEKKIDARKEELAKIFANVRPRYRKIVDDRGHDRLVDDMYYWKDEQKCAWMEHQELARYREDFRRATTFKLALLPFEHDQRLTEYTNCNGADGKWLAISTSDHEEDMLWNEVSYFAAAPIFEYYRLEYKQTPKKARDEANVRDSLFETKEVYHKFRFKIKDIVVGQGFNIFAPSFNLGITPEICDRYKVDKDFYDKWSKEN